jgi:putative tricarboxylic transport membrane protein
VDALGSLIQGFGVALHPINLLWAFVGAALGTAVGVLPGIGPALTIALLLPVTSEIPATSAFIMFAGIFYGAMYGGSTTSILLNTPGESGSMMTALEGNRMARSGRGAKALATAAIGSFVAGTLATLALTFLAPAIAELAFVFGPADYFALIVLSFTSISVVLGASRVRGFVSLFLGLALGVIGIDGQTGQARLTFGSPDLLDGMELTVVLVSLFAVGETLYVASRYSGAPAPINPLAGGLWLSREDWRRSWKPWLRGALIGFPIGALPAGGSEIPTFLSYTVEKRLAKKPEEFGRGAIEGVAGPEAANNAAVAGIMVPLLTLGLPTSATAAILLAAFQNYGLQPGPFLFTTNPDLVWGLIASLYIGNLMLLILNLPLVGIWVRLLLVPRPYLYGGILVFALIGVWGLSTSWVDLLSMVVIGLMGYVMRVYDFPIAPVLIGLILGPMAEKQLRQALAIAQGDPLVLVSSPIAASLLALAAVALLLPVVLGRLKREAEADETAPVEGPRPAS